MATLRNINWENILALSIRVIFLGFLDTIFRFSYQYLGWVSYIVRCLGLLTLLVVTGLPYSILLTVFRIMLGTSNIIIAWLVTSLFIKCGETPEYPVHILIILKLVQISLILFYYWFNEVNTLYRFAVHFYLFFMGGTVLQISPDWIFNALTIVSILCLVLLCLHVFERGILSPEEKMHINLYLQRFEGLELDDIINIFHRKEFSIYFIILFTVCLINNWLVVDLDQDINKTKLVFYTTLGMCCCSVISVIAFSTISIVICKHLLKFCYFIVKGMYESTQIELGLLIWCIVNVYFCTTDMIFFDMEPFDRGIFLSSRIVFLAVCSADLCSIIVQLASADVVAMQASGFSTLRVIGVHIAFCFGYVAILYGLIVQYSMKDLGIFLTTAYSVCGLIKSFASLFIYCLYKFYEIRQGFWENFDDVIFYTRITVYTITLVILMPTACVGVWTVFYGFYTWFDLNRLLSMWLVNVFFGIKVLLNTIRQRKRVLAYTTLLEDASNSQLNRDNCIICLQEMMKGKVTRCGHVFHEICIRKWLNTRTVCPLCNTSIVIYVQ
ncbi:RING finger protein 145-like isoform X2 [Mytilus californianus]|uniref:RING finger protein 145-like isoform X1 n=1 Tax=Mytilus californianus TaxID=6549 RepID=UPI002246E426|nr:RING finger protein 145-like isoform X1 [Mytilus californianus]XP_052105287.1 RING finger protein 145-like isoform X2 [Mytilus californianus]